LKEQLPWNIFLSCLQHFTGQITASGGQGACNKGACSRQELKEQHCRGTVFKLPAALHRTDHCQWRPGLLQQRKVFKAGIEGTTAMEQFVSCLQPFTGQITASGGQGACNTASLQGAIDDVKAATTAVL
jgi:hypothetical protein